MKKLFVAAVFVVLLVWLLSNSDFNKASKLEDAIMAKAALKMTSGIQLTSIFKSSNDVKATPIITEEKTAKSFEK